jgi:hypothetical protein
MKQIGQSLQLVLKEELDRDELGSQRLSDSLIHVGLGHSVFKVEDDCKEEVNELLKKYSTDRYYFRMSFIEDLSQDADTSRSYMTHDAKFFKPKVNGKTLYFLGLNFIIIEVERLQRSENFNIDNYRCVIRKLEVNAATGEIQEEVLWNKTKFGRIENYLPTKLRDFASAIYQCRCKLFSKGN